MVDRLGQQQKCTMLKNNSVSYNYSASSIKRYLDYFLFLLILLQNIDKFKSQGFLLWLRRSASPLSKEQLYIVTKLTKAIISLLWKLTKGIEMEKYLCLENCWALEKSRDSLCYSPTSVWCLYQDCKAVQIDNFSIWNIAWYPFPSALLVEVTCWRQANRWEPIAWLY